jgi:nucleotidyltransferase AbiEii toxin of type IV toxin-antitoxin system
MIDRYPDPDEIDAYAKENALDRADIVRDIARLVAIAHLCDRGFLNQDCVLTGGMALRLRGSTRFTVYDTDSSIRGRLDELKLAGSLSLDTDQLVIKPDEGAYWDRRAKLTIAQPVEYEAYFATVDPARPIEDQFAFTVNQRGLEMSAEWFPLTSPYPAFVFERAIQVPVMHITEQAAEKAIAWAAASLVKHYLDLAWIAREFAGDIDRDELRSMVEAKLDVGRKTFPASYKNLRGLADIRRPLAEPSGYFGPLNTARDTGADRIRFLGSAMPPAEAKRLVQEKLLPLLFD